MWYEIAVIAFTLSPSLFITTIFTTVNTTVHVGIFTVKIVKKIYDVVANKKEDIDNKALLV
jgi:hypothetical protein